MEVFFPDTYEASRERFLRDVESLPLRWHSSRLGSHSLTTHPDLSIDWLWAEPQNRNTLLIVSTGEHGIEGYVGSAMLNLFVEEFADRIDTRNAGLLLVHAINPWGMKYHRKVNENGVDLNRNFIFERPFDPSSNPDFSRLEYFLAPAQPVRSFGYESMVFAGRTLRVLIRDGASALSTAALLGQYVNPRGMFYGGAHPEEQSKVMMDFFHEALENYQNVLHLDMHSGYGPRYQMSITLVPQETRSSAELSTMFRYPLVQKGDRQEFYATNGDMTACLYDLRDRHFPGKHVFATAMEFGTYGDSLWARLRSLRTMILESQLYAYGEEDQNTAIKIRREFEELYFPDEQKWRDKAIQDCRQAFEGVLSAYGILKESH